MRAIFLFSLFLTLQMHAQVAFDPNAARLEMAARLGIGDVWMEDQLAELSATDRLSKMALRDQAIEADYGMDLAGYLLCMDMFERTARAADNALGIANIYFRELALPIDRKNALDPVFMDRAYREGTARVEVSRRYRAGNGQEMVIGLLCNDTVRRFTMSVR